MTPTEVLKHLQQIRFSPRAGRPVSIGLIARQAGYTPHGLFNAIRRGRISPDMAKRLSPTLARLVIANGGDIAPTLGRFGADDAAGRGHRRAPAPPGAPSRKA